MGHFPNSVCLTLTNSCPHTLRFPCFKSRNKSNVIVTDPLVEFSIGTTPCVTEPLNTASKTSLMVTWGTSAASRVLAKLIAAWCEKDPTGPKKATDRIFSGGDSSRRVSASDSLTVSVCRPHHNHSVSISTNPSASSPNAKRSCNLRQDTRSGSQWHWGHITYHPLGVQACRPSTSSQKSSRSPSPSIFLVALSASSTSSISTNDTHPLLRSCSSSQHFSKKFWTNGELERLMISTE